MSSDEEHDSIGIRQRKRRGPIAPSDDDDSSSDDSLIMPRKKGVRRVLSSSSSSSSSDHSDSGSEVEAGGSRRRRRAKDKAVVQSSDAESDSSSTGGEGNGCPICLGKLDGATLQGRPDGCEHIFCFECIVAWSRNNSTCPLCRTAVRNIKILLQGAVIEELPVKQITPEELDLNSYVNDIVCVVCNSSDREDTLLLCDECDDAYHCACLSPPLGSVPPGQWFCPRCVSGDVDDTENESLFGGGDASFGLFGPRTRATERVRRAVQSTRRGASGGGSGRTQNRRQRAAGSSGQRRATTATSAATTSRTSTTRKKPASTRSKGTRKRRSTTTGKGRKTSRRKTRRRKGGRRKTIVRKAYASSVAHQCRIARSLGLSDRVLNKLNRNSFGYSALSMDEPSTSRGVSGFEPMKLSRGGISGLVPDLHVFGNGNNFEPNGSDSEDDVAVRPRQSTQKVRLLSPPPPPPAHVGGDLLGGLLEKQSVLLSKKSELKRDPSGKVILVKDSVTSSANVTTSSSSSSSSRRTSSDISSPTKSVGHTFVSEARPTVSSDGVDMHYKPSRVSRVDMNVVSKYDATIENVLNHVMSMPNRADSSRQPQPSAQYSEDSAGPSRQSAASARCLERLRDIADAAASGTSIKKEIPDTSSSFRQESADTQTLGPYIKQEVPSPPAELKREPNDDERAYQPMKIKVEASALYGPEQLRRTVVVDGESEAQVQDARLVKSESPFYAEAEQNVARKRAVRATHGWINSLRLMTPTVINSLSAFSELEDDQPALQVSPSLHARLSVKEEPGPGSCDFDLSRVKAEPFSFDEAPPSSLPLRDKSNKRAGPSGEGGDPEATSSRTFKTERQDDERAFQEGQPRSKSRSYDDTKSTSDSNRRELSKSVKKERESDRGSGAGHSRRSRSRSPVKERGSTDRSSQIKKGSRSKERSPPNSPRLKGESAANEKSRSLRIKKERLSRERSPRIKKERLSRERSPRIKNERVSRERSEPRCPRIINQGRSSRERSLPRIKRERLSRERSLPRSPRIKRERRSNDRSHSRSPEHRRGRSRETGRRRSRSRSRERGREERKLEATRDVDRESIKRKGAGTSRDDDHSSRRRSRSRSRSCLQGSRRAEKDTKDARRKMDASLDERKRRKSPSLDDKRRKRSPSADAGRRPRSPSVKSKRRRRSTSIGEERKQKRSPSLERRRRKDSPGLERKQRKGSSSAEGRERRNRSVSIEDERRRKRSASREGRRRYKSPSVEDVRRRKRSPKVEEARRKRSPSGEDRREQNTSVSGRREDRTRRRSSSAEQEEDDRRRAAGRSPTKSGKQRLHRIEKGEHGHRSRSIESPKVVASKVELDHLKVESPEPQDEDRPSSSSNDDEVRHRDRLDEIKPAQEAALETVTNESSPCQSSGPAESKTHVQLPAADPLRSKIEESLDIVASDTPEQSLPSSTLTPALSVALQSGRPVLLVPGPIAGTYVVPGAEAEIQPPQPASSTTPSHHAEGYSSGVDSDDNNLDELELITSIPEVDTTRLNNNSTHCADAKPAPEPKTKEKLPKFFVDNGKFQDVVVKEVGSYLKKFYKKHQVSKEDYKEIFKKVMKKICKSSSDPKRLVCVRSIRKLCDFYVQKARLQIKKDCMFSDDVD